MPNGPWYPPTRNAQREDAVKFGVSYNTGAYGVVDPDAMIAAG